MNSRTINLLIRDYAKAYSALQELQERCPLIPEGDQKTGCIGEYYAHLYLQTQYRILQYGSLSEKGWDLDADGRRFQVKTVSAYSKTRVISPIHPGWDELFVFYLDRNFIPLGFWVITEKLGIQKGRRCPHPEKSRTGSLSIPFGENRIAELKKSLKDAQVFS